MSTFEIGSRTARGGFDLEKLVVDKFNNWQNDNDADRWLSVMGVEAKKIKNLMAQQIPTRIPRSSCSKYGIEVADFDEVSRFKKADVQVRVVIVLADRILVFNISVKKVSTANGFNQIDKRPVSMYQSMWRFDDDVAYWLKAYTGEISPQSISGVNSARLKDPRRLNMNEVPTVKVRKILDFFNDNKYLIVADTIKGRGCLSAEWFIVGRELDDNVEWIIKPINEVVNHYCAGSAVVSTQGTIHLGRVTVQRKGGTPDPTSLQFKINPGELFDV